MSYIFDGLRRSDKERPDVIPLGKLGVTELLQRAERTATAKWEASARQDTDVTTNPTPTYVKKIESAPAERFEGKDQQSTIQPSPLLNQFPSLDISISPEARLPSLTDSGSPAAEAFRLLGVRLRHIARDRGLKRLLITSTIPQEGKSMVSANLACTLALKTHQKVLMLEGDMRRPSLSRMFGVDHRRGLREWLEDNRGLEDCIYHLRGPNVWILPASSSPGNALELLQPRRLSALMEQLSGLFDWVIIDSPPVLPMADTSIWMRFADGILLTTRQGITERRKLKKGLEALEHKKLLGALVNSSKDAVAGDYYYYSSDSSSSTLSSLGA
jgi:capsular exopolysaccharide synthesis family protein